MRTYTFDFVVLAMTALMLAVGLAIVTYALDTRIGQLERMDCGLVQYEDLSVAFQTDDAARWTCAR